MKALIGKVLLGNVVVLGILWPGLAVAQDACVKPASWHTSQKFHYQPTYYCGQLKCVLNDESGGTINRQDPSKSTYWEKVDWTLINTETSAVLATGQCQKVPPVANSKYCHGTANGPITCAYQYSQYTASAKKVAKTNKSKQH